MIKIMFVCHGNICRSPMAEFIFRKMAEERGVASLFYVESRATHTDEIFRGVGSPVYPSAKREMERHGLSFEGKRATLLRRDDVSEYDLFVGMDSANVRNMLRILGDSAREKIHRLLEFTGENRDVADPWYTDEFDVAYSDIEAGCAALLDFLMEESF